MYYQMKRDLQNFYKNTLQDKQNFLKEVQISDDKTNQKIKLQGVYFLKTYIIDLWGWSGLQKWYELLTKHKKKLDNMARILIERESIYQDGMEIKS